MNQSWCRVVALLLVVGCEVEVGERVAALVPGSDCEELNCPGNSDLMGVLLPYELDRTGALLSSRGVRLVGVNYKGLELQITKLGVDGTSVRVTVGNVTYSNAAITGLRLAVRHEPEGQEPKTYHLYFQSYTKVPYYTGSGAFWGYRIRYGLPGQEVLKELCPYEEVSPDHGVAATWAVVWQGDRYNPESGEIFASDDEVGPWFNISCAGEATIKMLRTRTGGAVRPTSPVEQRQATLNMFTAAYCGPGGPRVTTSDVPFTKLGQPLTWSDVSGPSHLGAGASIEAVWDDHGAVCLTTPRKADVLAHEIVCDDEQPQPIEPCTQDQIDHWQDHGWLLSGTPAP